MSRKWYDTGWFAATLTGVISTLVVYAVYLFYLHIYMPEHDACSARGGVVVRDAMGVWTCAQNPGVLVSPRR